MASDPYAMTAAEQFLYQWGPEGKAAPPMADQIAWAITRALNYSENYTDIWDDLEEDELPLPELGPVSRLGKQPQEPRVEFESFHPEAKRTPEFIDQMTSTPRERRIAQETAAGATPGSPAHFQAAQAATMPAERRWFKQENGRIDNNNLIKIEGGAHFLKPAAAKAYKAMQRAAKRDGIDFAVTDSYRDYDAQVRLAREKGLYSEGGLAAEPGTSNHGWGLAVDINVNDPKVLAWLEKHGSKYGFKTIPREPWHWEYEGGYTPRGRSQPRRQQRQGQGPQAPPEQTDPMTLARTTSSAVLAPMSFASVLGELQEPKPQTRREYKEHKKAAGLGFVPKKYRSWFVEAGEKHNISPRLLAAMANTETGGFAQDVINFERDSSAGAKGMMQVMPLHTATYGDKFTKNVRENIMVGAAIFASYLNAAEKHHLSRQYNPFRVALAMYNAGVNASDAVLTSRFSVYSDPILDLWRGRT